MTLAQLCDLAYMVQVQEIEEDQRSLDIAAIIVKANGGEGEVPTLSERIEKFNKALSADLKSSERDVTKRFYGIG